MGSLAARGRDQRPARAAATRRGPRRRGRPGCMISSPMFRSALAAIVRAAFSDTFEVSVGEHAQPRDRIGGVRCARARSGRRSTRLSARGARSRSRSGRERAAAPARAVRARPGRTCRRDRRFVVVAVDGRRQAAVEERRRALSPEHRGRRRRVGGGARHARAAPPSRSARRASAGARRPRARSPGAAIARSPRSTAPTAIADESANVARIAAIGAPAASRERSRTPAPSHASLDHESGVTCRRGSGRPCCRRARSGPAADAGRARGRCPERPARASRGSPARAPSSSTVTASDLQRQVRGGASAPRSARACRARGCARGAARRRRRSAAGRGS